MGQLADEIVERRIRNVALELTEACNYKCIMCDYWRLSAPKSMSIESARAFLDLFPGDTLKSVLMTGGEPLLNRYWRDIAALLPAGARKSVCTNGSPILMKNRDIGKYFDRVTVSIDGARKETFAAIRGYDHLYKIFDALEHTKSSYPNTIIYLKMTIQRQNFREIVELMEVVSQLEFVDGVGFGALDFSEAAFAFDREKFNRDPYIKATLLTETEIDEFERYVIEFETRYRTEIENGFVYEGDLRRYLNRYKSLRGQPCTPQPRNCIIPNVSAVLRADGSILGCYFLPSMITLDEVLASGVERLEEIAFRHSSAGNQTCARCDQLLFRNSPFELPPV
ncbi:radical SAM protein [Ensifer sp. ENS09]|uniref:radical SAM protein n=1 Tax=Ensifer sp. ENS09 TaxID=2769263 RepID=UPI00177B1EDF|nr:radical SAM protein [Ensifer sp. ENS09]MBD9653130.1 radical SAM protein [Ensifer sp. ENS09]